MQSGVIPPNRNADSIDPALQAFTHLYHPTQPIYLSSRLDAVLMKSFGFGQVGGELLVVHPDYVLACLKRGEYEAYIGKRTIREKKAGKAMLDGMLQVKPLVQVKTAPPYAKEDEQTVLLNPLARATFDATTGSYLIKNPNVSHIDLKIPKIPVTGTSGVGIDVQLLADLPMDNPDFLERNFTPTELAYCHAQPDPRSSLAGRWAAKEAIIKALCSAAQGKRQEWLKGAGAPLKPIEILPSGLQNPAPTASINGQACPARLSISHSGAYAVAIAILPE